MRPLRPLFALVLLAAPLAAQGLEGYFNVESPQVHPIEVARVDGRDYLLICNTPDNALEVWSTREVQPIGSRFVTRVPVGLEPVTVRFVPELGRAYVASFLGDSVSVVRLQAQGGTLEARLERTVNVGDEPVDVAYAPPVPFGAEPRGAGPAGPVAGPGGGGGAPGPATGPGGATGGPVPNGALEGSGILYVSLFSRHALTLRHPLTLEPLAPELERVDLLDPQSDPPRALKEPRTLAVTDDGLLVASFKGGNSSVHDFDLFVGDRAGGFLAGLGGLGTTLFAMRRDGDDLFAVGLEARNGLDTEPVVAAAETGFVMSTLFWVRDVEGREPQSLRRDLNVLTEVPLTPVPKADALSTPTDLAVFRSGPGQDPKVFVAAMGSDRLGVLEPTADVAPVDWPLRRIAIPAQSGPFAGPRGLALKPRNPADLLDPGPRLYVLNRADQSFVVVDPVGETVLDAAPLERDPTPETIRAGRPFLYSAEFSGNGIVSCASCHVDGRTDALTWNLGAPRVSQPFPEALADGLPHDDLLDGDCDDEFNDAFDAYVAGGYPLKEDIVTQSLQGLLNTQVEPSTADVVTNAPYHWRADRAGLADFNPAFVALLGLDPIPATDPPVGLTDAEMSTFEDFVNSIHYPPNPDQPITREYSGDFGDPELANDEDVGSGAQRGMKLFHTRGILECFGMSCVQCHTLPDYSNNRITELTAQGFGMQPIETAALRGLIQKEARLDRDGTEVSDVVIGKAGLADSGTRKSVNDFAAIFINNFGGFDEKGEFGPDMVDLNTFLHELDWGVAPAVGQVVTFAAQDATDPGLVERAMLLEEEVRKANVDLVAHLLLEGEESGFTFDPTTGTGVYRPEPSGTAVSRDQLLGLLAGPDERLVLHAVPLGTGRRVASLDGPPAPRPGPAPSALALQPMRPHGAWRDVPLLTKNWIVEPVAMGFSFLWFNVCAPTPRHAKALRTMQSALVIDAALQGGFGVTGQRHEVSRRLRVAGHDLRRGAVLQLHVPNDDVPPDPDGPLGQIATRRLELTLHPSGERLADGREVWETAAELDALTAYTLMLGGPLAPGVLVATNDVLDIVPEPLVPGLFDPIGWNWHWVRVVNADGTAGDGGWQRLTMD